MTARRPRPADLPNWPRLMPRAQVCEYLGGVSVATLNRWVSAGRIPGPIDGTTRWDRLAIDRALDRVSGLEQPADAEGSEWAGAFQ